MQKIRWKDRFQNYQLALQNINETYDCIKDNGLNKIYIMALVQTFEIIFELAWKTLKDFLEYEGIQVNTPRETIKTAFLRNIIEDGQTWIAMLETRNKTSHTYNEDFAKLIANEIINDYMPLFKDLELTLAGKLNEQ